MLGSGKLLECVHVVNGKWKWDIEMRLKKKWKKKKDLGLHGLPSIALGFESDTPFFFLPINVVDFSNVLWRFKGGCVEGVC